MSAETRRVKGTIEGNTDVIKAFKTIENKDEFFGKLKYMNKSFNKNKVRISLSPDGKVLINNAHKVDVNKMYRMGPAGRNKLLAKYGPAKVTTKNAPTRIYSSTQVAGSSKVPVNEFLLCNVRPEEIIKISAFLINLSAADQDFLLDLLSNISEVLHDGFLLVCTELVISLIPAELEFLHSIVPDWKRRLIFFVFQFLKSKISIDEDDNAFMAALKTYIRDGRIDRETLLILKKKLMDFFEKLKKDKYARNKTWEEGDDYISNYRGSFSTLQVGQELVVGSHKILIKQTTVDNIEMWLENYSQEYCDSFMELCFKMIESLSTEEVRRLSAINPDEDIMVRVSIFLLDRFDTYIEAISTVDAHELLLLLKTELVEWCSRQRTRKQYTCAKCKGICFYESK